MTLSPGNTLWFPLELGDQSPCPYLPDHQSLLAFGIALPSEHQLDNLLAQGYRRLGYIFYLPHCPGGCRACQPLRVPIEHFAPSRSQRRLLKRAGSSYSVRRLSPCFDRAHFDIYRRHARWVSEENDPCSPQAYRSAFVDTAVTTHFFEFRVDGQLVGVSILDEGDQAVSSVYACWDPAYARQSPGTFSALWEIDWARRHGKAYYYLGYWVEDCRQMRYKSRFRPHEIYDWQQRIWTPTRP